jgi:hypothetical protein
MPGGEPRVRAKHLQVWLSLAKRRLEPTPYERFTAGVPSQDWQRIEAAVGSSWLPMELDVTLADAMHATLGPKACHRFYIDLTLEALGGPLLSPLVGTWMRMFGADPSKIAQWWPKGWTGLFQDCGELSGEPVSEHVARLYYSDLPAFCVASAPWVESLQSSAYAVFPFLKREGVVRLSADAPHRAVTLELEW